MRVILIISLLSLTYSCNNNRASIDNTEESVSLNVREKTNQQEKRLNNIGLGRHYETAKWLMYCLYCDRVCEFYKTKKIDTVVSFGELELVCDSFSYQEDTVAFYLSFYMDTVACDSRNLYNYPNFDVISLIISRDSVYSFAQSDGSITFRPPPNPKDRLYNPTQPEVVRYIRKNKDKINQWFYAQAVKRGIL